MSGRHPMYLRHSRDRARGVGDVACADSSVQNIKSQMAQLGKIRDAIERDMETGTWSDKAKTYLDKAASLVEQAAFQLTNAITKS